MNKNSTFCFIDIIKKKVYASIIFAFNAKQYFKGAYAYEAAFNSDVSVNFQ